MVVLKYYLDNAHHTTIKHYTIREQKILLRNILTTSVERLVFRGNFDKIRIRKKKEEAMKELNVEKVLDEMISEIKRGSRLLTYQKVLESLTKEQKENQE